MMNHLGELQLKYKMTLVWEGRVNIYSLIKEIE